MDKKLKILLDKVNESDPNLNTMDRNTRIRAGNYQFSFSGQQMDYLLLTLAKKLSEEDVLVIEGGSTGPISYLRCADSTGTAVYFASITKSLKYQY